MKNKNLLTLFFLLIILLVGCTKSSKAGDSSIQKSFIIAGALATNDGIFTEERQVCYQAVLVMNQCVGGSGFNPAIMCSSSSTYTLADYQALVNCVATQVQLTYCNFPQNKAADPRVALSNFFSSCQKDANGDDANIIIPSF